MIKTKALLSLCYKLKIKMVKNAGCVYCLCSFGNNYDKINWRVKIHQEKV